MHILWTIKSRRTHSLHLRRSEWILYSKAILFATVLNKQKKTNSVYSPIRRLKVILRTITFCLLFGHASRKLYSSKTSQIYICHRTAQQHCLAYIIFNNKTQKVLSFSYDVQTKFQIFLQTSGRFFVIWFISPGANKLGPIKILLLFVQ